MGRNKKENHCIICNNIIFNRKSNAKYCLECAKNQIIEKKENSIKKKKLYKFNFDLFKNEITELSIKKNINIDKKYLAGFIEEKGCFCKKKNRDGTWHKFFRVTIRTIHKEKFYDFIFLKCFKKIGIIFNKVQLKGVIYYNCGCSKYNNFNYQKFVKFILENCTFRKVENFYLY